MAFKDGDFIEVEYSAWTASDNKLIATTDENKAKAENMYDKRTRYGPVLVVLGSNSVIKGLDRELRTAAVNETKRVTFKPGEAFGERAADLVRVMPMSEFRKHDIDPYPGMEVNIDNAVAIVKSINSGRVTIDLNHRYAGQDITYDIKVIRQLTSEGDKVKALGITYNVEPSEVRLKERSVEIVFNDKVKKNADYFVGKASMIAAIFTYMDDKEKVDVLEEYLKPNEQKPGAEEEQQEQPD
ncbi:MAG: FKBP-type peptidyl-prolyl cis-trans isomerase [Candidatus Micrarchaeaceae archaeon]